MNSPMHCVACGTRFPADYPLNEGCPICLDDRQYVPPGGQAWVEATALQRQSRVDIHALLPVTDTLAKTTQIYSLKVVPRFGIGNRALLVQSPSGNILWDCIPVLDEPTRQMIQSIGGLQAIAISHPHFYSNMQNWAEIFDCPVYIHASDARWVVDKGTKINFWECARQAVFDGISIIHTGGHFPGSSVLSIPALSAGGTVLCSDSLYVAPSKKHVAVMYSYPNQILLPKPDFVAFEASMSAVPFDSLIGAFENQELLGNAPAVYDRSMQKYKAAYQIPV